MNLWLVSVTIAAVGAFILLTALTLPATSPGQKGRPRAVHLTYGLLACLLAGVSVWLWNNDLRVKQAERRLVELLDGHYSPEGLVHVAMNFLEKHRNVYPEAYERAVAFCEARRCHEPPPSEQDEPREYSLRINELYEAAVMLRSTLVGLAPVEGENPNHPGHNKH
jgi:hypothetical protein